MFYVGQKVVCISVNFERSYDAEIFPELNGIYTIRAIYLDSDNDQFFKLVEIQNQVFEYGDTGLSECGFYHLCFRPIVDTKAEVSFTIGAHPDSDKWDNRKVKVK